jgi:translation initiation factor 5A
MRGISRFNYFDLKSLADSNLSRPSDLGSVKEGSYIIIDDEPCRVVELEKSKPGKHGSAKVRLVGIGVFTGAKRSYVSPAESRIEIPIIDKRSGQVISVTQGTVQLMDLQTFEVFETPLPTETEFQERLQPGTEVEYWSVMGKRKLMRIKGTG